MFSSVASALFFRKVQCFKKNKDVCVSPPEMLLCRGLGGLQRSEKHQQLQTAAECAADQLASNSPSLALTQPSHTHRHQTAGNEAT